ncbi:hypothetical protein [Rhizobium sp. BR 314]|uniref:hypothetical protein n=1 Tax=Rhizobium sp. BR 314 TaxID=3040013 RepID=UPI0039BFDF03
MRRIEAFTLGKKFDHPELNEDSMVIMPGLGYAVIDGVTDRNGTCYDGMLSGQFASRTVKRALEHFLLGYKDPSQPFFHYRGPWALVRYLNSAIRRGYEANNALAEAEADWRLRAGCTLMIAFNDGDYLQIVAVGDSGIRINGSEILQPVKQIDDVTAILRLESWRFFESKGVPAKDCNRLAATLLLRGTQNQEAGTETAAPDVVEIIEERVLSACKLRLPRVPEWELRELIHKGIANGQGDFQNVTDRVLGYGGLDGFSLPEKYIETRRYPLSDINTIELFSDGYFELGLNFGVASWEESFRNVEFEDPHKIGRYMSTKGTTEAALTDDRTYLGVKFR